MKFAYDNEKKKRLMVIGLVFGGIGLFVWMLLDFTGGKEEVKEVATINVVNKEQSLEEGYKVRFGEDLLKLKDTNNKLLKEIENLNKKTELLSGHNKKLQDDLKNTENKLQEDLLAMKLAPPETPEDLKEKNKKETDEKETYKIPPPPADINMQQSNDVVVPIGVDNKNGPQVTVLTNLISVGEPIGKSMEEEKKEEILKKPSLKIPAGSFVKGMLLSGVIAPTMGEGLNDPIPSLLRVTGISNLPNFSKADIRGCFILAETKGNLATETVSFRLKTLSCIKNDGSTYEKPITGYVTGENGMEGLPGRVVSKQGAIIARAFAAEFAGGIAEAFEEQGQIVSTTASGVVTTLDPNKTLETGLFAGTSAALNRISEFYMDLAENMVPVIEINSGRKIDIVFTTEVNFDEVEDKKEGK